MSVAQDKRGLAPIDPTSNVLSSRFLSVQHKFFESTESAHAVQSASKLSTSVSAVRGARAMKIAHLELHPR